MSLNLIHDFFMSEVVVIDARVFLAGRFELIRKVRVILILYSD